MQLWCVSLEKYMKEGLSTKVFKDSLLLLK